MFSTQRQNQIGYCAEARSIRDSKGRQQNISFVSVYLYIERIKLQRKIEYCVTFFEEKPMAWPPGVFLNKKLNVPDMKEKLYW